MIAELGVRGKKIAFLGNISNKKGVEMLIHSFQAVHEWDSEYTLHIGGAIQDSRYAVYLDHIIPELDLQDSIHYYDKIEKPLEWLPNFDFILVSSPLEGCPVGVLEALSCGLTPILYSFVGANGLYPPHFIWKTFPELIEMLKKGPQDPEKYKKFVKEHYSKASQLEKIDTIIENLLKDVQEKPEIAKNSTVACVIAVKNGEKTIGRTLESLICQTKKLDQIIVVNDASTDNTVKVISEFATFHKDSTINAQIITLPESKWVFSARNEGFKRVDTDYFFFLDADDWVTPDYVKDMVDILDDNSGISIVYPDMIYFDDNGDTKQFNQPEFNPQLLTQQNFISYSSMQRTEAFRHVGQFSDYLNDTRNHLTEWALWLRYVQMGYGFKRLAKPLFHYYHSSTSDQMSVGYERSRDDMSLELALLISDYDYTSIKMHGDKKKIVLVIQGKDYCDRSKVGFELMQVYKPLEEFGDVYAFQYDVEMIHFGRTEMQERLKKFIDTVEPDYVFHFTYKADILPATWKEISDKYCTIAFNSDDDRRYEEFTKAYTEPFKYVVTTYPHVYALMSHHGRILSSWGANQFYFKPIIDRKLLQSNMLKEKTIDVSFVGQKYGDREELISDLDIELYGNGWPNGFVDFKEMAKIIASSKISINFSKGADGNKQIKLRPFEICACNTLCMCEYVEGMEEYYTDGKEIIFFADRSELVEKVNYYLNHEVRRKAIAQAGYDRTVNNHLWSNRFGAIFEQIEKEVDK
jgi:spore maturation protein CgeB